MKKASLFSEDFGEKGGRPSKPIFKELGNFSIALGYAIMMGVVAATAIVLPLAAYGNLWFNAIPLITTAAGVSAWYGWARWRHRKDNVDAVVAYYDRKGHDYIKETEPLDMREGVERFARHLPTSSTESGIF